ncbi:MAG: phosphoenolpyruvate--protein phosphotransferase, partial [Bacteroidales bacterium]|nr:phosphoenolpyruvate--protein phosphotransferase [Bacteroidales bacterium]
MQSGKGLGIVEGMASGKLVVLRPKPATSDETAKAVLPSRELDLYLTARKQAQQQLRLLQEQSAATLGKEQAAIFEAQAMMLMDEDFEEAVSSLILKKNHSATQAVRAGGEKIAALFPGMEEEQMRSKSADVLDLVQRLCLILSGQTETPTLPSEAFILMAKDLSPGELMQWRSPQLKGIVLSQGSAHSHLAILAAAMKLPCIIKADIDTEQAFEYTMLALDATSGIFYLDPELRFMSRFKQKLLQEDANRQIPNDLRFYGPRGEEIEVLANIGSLGEIDPFLQRNCSGIGLFRSEFLFMGRRELPSEEEQFELYRHLATGMEGKKVVIRTLDVGADKDAPCLDLAKEENPALGNRGIRLCLQREDIFRTQLRAVCRASVYGNLMLMVPMLISVDELLRVKGLLHEIQQELRQEGLEVPDLPLGAMIETPASVMLCAELAAEADFLSIGTNDLTQYTLAVDRQNVAIAPLYQQTHPAVLRMLREVIRVAKAEQIPCSICGELAHDTTHTGMLIEMGFSAFSMAPVHIPAFRKFLNEHYPCS